VEKEADRIRRWRERKKAEGKTSFTILLSQEARVILTHEKEKTGESYAVIVEKALKALKEQGYGPPALKQFSKPEEALARVSARDNQPQVIPFTKNESGGQPRILIDDLANYPRIKDIERKQAGEMQNDIYDLKSNERLFTRLLRFSKGPFRQRKKWFK